MKVWIDQDLCTGDGLCEEIAPDVFALLDDGLAYVKDGDKVLSDPGGPEAIAPIPDGQLEAVIESAEEFATLKKGDKPVRSSRPRRRFAPFFCPPASPRRKPDRQLPGRGCGTRRGPIVPELGRRDESLEPDRAPRRGEHPPDRRTPQISQHRPPPFIQKHDARAARFFPLPS